MSGIRTITVATALSALAGAAQAQFLNGDFESGDLSGWTITPTTNGQTTLQTVELHDLDGAGPLPESRAAKFAVGQVTFQSGVHAGIELTQVLTLPAGPVTFACDAGAFRPPGSVNNAEGGRFALIVDGTAIATVAIGSIGGGNPIHRRLSGEFIAPAAGNYTVGVRITRPFTIPAGLFQFVDNFEPTELPCYPDCDTSTGPGVLDIFDFLCFQNRYDVGSPYACDCDTSTGPGVCDIFDFLCFQNAYDAGCP